MEGKSLATQVQTRKCTWEFTWKLRTSERTEPALSKEGQGKESVSLAEPYQARSRALIILVKRGVARRKEEK